MNKLSHLFCVFPVPGLQILSRQIISCGKLECFLEPCCRTALKNSFSGLCTSACGSIEADPLQKMEPMVRPLQQHGSTSGLKENPLLPEGGVLFTVPEMHSLDVRDEIEYVSARLVTVMVSMQKPIKV